MSEWHLQDLRNQLQREHWHLVAELSGNDYDISGVWQVSRPNGSSVAHLEFEGLDDMQTLPLDRAFACRIREAPGISLYFRKKGGYKPVDLADEMVAPTSEF